MMNNEELLKEAQRLYNWKESISRCAKKLGITNDHMRELFAIVRKKLKDSANSYIEQEQRGLQSSSENIQNGTRELIVNIPCEIHNLQELIEHCKIDTNVWNIEKYVQNYWGNCSDPHWQVKTWLYKKKIDTDLLLQKELILKELKEDFIPVHPIKRISNPHAKLAYEINIPDIHFGKLAWDEETGGSYDLHIARDRFRTAVERLLNLININDLDEIIFPIGNDMINIDSRRNETYMGTRQDSDSRFFKIVKVVRSILIETIDSLSQIAPVKVIDIRGNHDPESMFMMGEILDAYYHNNPNVSIDNSPKQRKYYQYGVNGFQYTHGNEERHQDLGLIFATEEPKLWADTKFRFCKLGHFHKNKKIQYVAVEDHSGFQVQILPSLSGSDAWTNSKGYMPNNQAKAFLYHHEDGQIGEFTYSVK